MVRSDGSGDSDPPAPRRSSLPPLDGVHPSRRGAALKPVDLQGRPKEVREKPVHLREERARLRGEPTQRQEQRTGLRTAATGPRPEETGLRRSAAPSSPWIAARYFH
jgi:hypothetical protein